MILFNGFLVNFFKRPETTELATLLFDKLDSDMRFTLELTCSVVEPQILNTF